MLSAAAEAKLLTPGDAGGGGVCPPVLPSQMPSDCFSQSPLAGALGGGIRNAFGMVAMIYAQQYASALGLRDQK